MVILHHCSSSFPWCLEWPQLNVVFPRQWNPNFPSFQTAISLYVSMVLKGVKIVNQVLRFGSFPSSIHGSSRNMPFKEAKYFANLPSNIPNADWLYCFWNIFPNWGPLFRRNKKSSKCLSKCRPRKMTRSVSSFSVIWVSVLVKCAFTVLIAYDCVLVRFWYI